MKGSVTGKEFFAMPAYRRNALIISFIILSVCAGSIYLLLRTGAGQDSGSTPKKAAIYQNGDLLETIDLSLVTSPYQFTVNGENGCSNVIQVQPGSIAIVSADCPDKLCVHQGAISTSLLPITCLPNRLVIQIEETGGNWDTPSPSTDASIDIDIITH